MVRGRYTMGRGFDIPWVGVRYTMGRGGSQYSMGNGVDIPWVGGRYTVNSEIIAMFLLLRKMRLKRNRNN